MNTKTLRPRQFIEVLENPSLPRCRATGEHAEILRTLLVHMFFVDLDLAKGEVALLARVLPDVDVRKYIESAARRRLDLDQLAALFPDPVDRDDIVTLAEHAVWSDSQVKGRELDLMDQLVEKLGVQRA